MSKRKEIFRDAGIYALSSYAAQAFDFVSGILVRNFLGPANMGIWAFLQVIQNYAKHSGLGVTTATARDVPYYLGKGEPEKAREIQNLVFTFSVITTFLTAAAIAGWAVWNRQHYSKPIVIGLFVMAALIILQRLYNLFVVVIRSHKQFTFAGWLNIVSSVLSLAFAALLAWKFQLYGYYAAMILTFAALLAVILVKTPHRFQFDFRWTPLIPLLHLGLAVVVSDILRSILMSIDRIMIAKYLGFQSLGHYSIALMAGNYLYSLPNMINVIFFPHFQETLAKRDALEDLEKLLKLPLLCTAYLFPFCIALVWTSSAWIIPLLLPKYTQGIPALKYFILGSFFMALTHPFNTFLITAKKHWVLIPAQGLSILAGFSLSWMVLGQGGDIAAVAAVSSFTYAVLFFTLALLTRKEVPALGIFRLLGKLCLPFAAMSLFLFLLDRYSPGAAFTGFLLQYSIFVILMLPCLFLAEKETGLLSTAAAVFREKMHSKNSTAGMDPAGDSSKQP